MARGKAMKNLAIFYGGKSAEHDISIITALQVIKNLDTKLYKIIPIYIQRDNSWSVVNNYDKIYNYTIQKPKCKKLATGFFNGWLIAKTPLGLKKFKKVDVAINCCHGLNGEDGTLSGLLQLCNIAYVGSDVTASAVGMDKVIMKDTFVANQIPCVNYMHFFATDFSKNSEQILNDAQEKLNYPIVVKPANLGSSIGINISKNREELQKNIKIALNFDKKIILEQAVPNLREINCSVIGNTNVCEASILEEPKNWKTFLNFDEKYLLGNKNNSKKTIDVKLPKRLETQIKNLAKSVFKLLGCAGVARVDFLLNDQTKQVYVNEINTIPGSFANYLWSKNYSFGQLLNKLIRLAEEEYICKNAYKYTYESQVLNNYKGGKIKGVKK